MEEGTSKARLLAIYFVAGLLGNVAFMLTDAGSVVGASGCVFGLLGAAMLLNPSKTVSIYVIPLPLGVVAALFIVIETLMASAGATAVTGVAHVAHLAGVVTGAVFALFIDPKKSAKGLVVLALCMCLLIILGPLFELATGIGSFILEIIDAVVGFVLYGIARLLSLVWAVVL